VCNWTVKLDCMFRETFRRDNAPLYESVAQVLHIKKEVYPGCAHCHAPGEILNFKPASTSVQALYISVKLCMVLLVKRVKALSSKL
jgi:hypothetical protein